jgi:hypothetical protein
MKITLLVPITLIFAACTPAPEAVTVAEISTPAATGSMAPSITGHPDGGMVIDWMEPDGDGYALRYIRSAGDSWSEPHTIARGDDWFVNWADFPAVSISSDGRWSAHWLQREAAGTYAYGVRVASSSDDGLTWGDPITPHRDGTPTEHGFVSHYNDADGTGLVWLDGRETLTDGAEGHGAGGMTLRHAMIANDETMTDEIQLDGLTCDCCQTDVAISASGPIVAYRDRTTEEIRDIYVVRRTADGWTEPSVVHADGWEMAACPVNGPAVAARGDEVVVAWYTAAQGAGRVMIARSLDGGMSFEEPSLVDDNMPMGRLDLIAGDHGYVVAWYGRDAAGPALLMRPFDAAGLGPVTSITPVSEARRSGFPRMARQGDDLVVTWTEVNDDVPQVRAARVSGLLR